MKILELKSKLNVEYFLFGVIILLGLIFTFIIPPFQKPDENVHFLRAITISRGEFFCNTDENGNKTFTMPQKYFDYISEVGTQRIAFNYGEKFYFNDIRKAELKESTMDGISNFEACTLSFVAYVPTALMVLIGNLFDSISLSFFLGRFFNLLIFITSLSWSYRKIKESNLKWLLIAYALIPMVMHQVTVVGYDPLQLAAIPIIFSITVSSIINKSKLGWKDIVLYVVSMALLLVAKPGYYFMPLLYFLIPSNRFTKSKKEYIIYTVIYFAICIFASLLTVIFLGNGGVLEDKGETNPMMQLKLLSDPMFFIILVKNTIEGGLQFYLQSFIGSFGWLDYGLPYPVYFIYILSWFVLIFKIKEDSFFDKLYFRTLVIGFVIFLTFGFIFGSMFITLNPVGSIAIAGVQGRYFLVLFPFIILLGAGLIRIFTENKYIRAVSILLLALYIILQVSYVIYKRYYDYSFNYRSNYSNTQLISFKSESK